MARQLMSSIQRTNREPGESTAENGAVAENEEPPATEHTEIHGSGAEIHNPDDFGYENFHISGYHATIDEEEAVAEELREQFLDAEDCMTHVWPAEFKVLQRHASSRLQPILQERGQNHGMSGMGIPAEDLEWILLQSAWLVVFVGSSSEEIAEQLLWTHYGAVEDGEGVGETLEEEAVYQMLEIQEDAQAISAIALYPRVLSELQLMLKSDFFQTISPDDAPTTPTLSAQNNMRLWNDETWSICTTAELHQLAEEAEAEQDFHTLSRIQKVLMVRSGPKEDTRAEEREASPDPVGERGGEIQYNVHGMKGKGGQTILFLLYAVKELTAKTT